MMKFIIEISRQGLRVELAAHFPAVILTALLTLVQHVDLLT